MADRWAVATGNWSNTATWNGGTLPTAADDVFADGFTVTIDQDVTVLSIRNTQRSGGTSGGSFTLQSGRTVSATGTGFKASTVTCISFTASGSPSVLNGNCQSDGAGATVYNNGSTNTLTINGNITNYQGSGNPTIDCNNNGTTIINGSVTGSVFANGTGVRAQGNNSCLVTINGQVSGGSGAASYGVNVIGSAQLTIVGNVSGGAANANGVYLNGSSNVLNVTGNVSGGYGSPSYGILRNNPATININGNVTGGGLTYTNSIGVNLDSSGVCTINGNITGGVGSGGNCHGVRYNSTSKLTVNGNITAVNNNTAILMTNIVSDFDHLSGNLISALNGRSPLGLYFHQVSASGQQTFKPRVASTLAERIFYTANAMPSSITPLAADVRSGVSYASGERTGTCAVPPVGSVALGVPVDNTTGTGLINQTVLQAALEAALAPNAANIVERSTNDNKAITFSWPVSGATITGQKSIDNGAYTAVVGAITFLRTESNRHYYALAYNAADRNTVESSIRYKMTDGTYTKYFNLHVVPSGDVEVNVAPFEAISPVRVVGTSIQTFIGDQSAIRVRVINSEGNAVDLSTQGTLQVVIEKRNGVDLQTATPTIDGADNSYFNFTPNSASVANSGEYRWSLRKVSSGEVLAFGDWVVDPAAKADA